MLIYIYIYFFISYVIYKFLLDWLKLFICSKWTASYFCFPYLPVGFAKQRQMVILAIISSNQTCINYGEINEMKYIYRKKIPSKPGQLGPEPTTLSTSRFGQKYLFIYYYKSYIICHLSSLVFRLYSFLPLFHLIAPHGRSAVGYGLETSPTGDVSSPVGGRREP